MRLLRLSRQNGLAAGCGLKVLLADIHAFLDSLGTPIELVESRVEFYRRTITAMLEAVGDSTKKLTFVLGSSYQQSPQYIMNVYKLSSHITEHDAKRAGADVVKQFTNGPLNGLLYPILQALDEKYLDVDIQFGGISPSPSRTENRAKRTGLDQRKLFIAAKEWLHKLSYKQVASFHSSV